MSDYESQQMARLEELRSRTKSADAGSLAVDLDRYLDETELHLDQLEAALLKDEGKEGAADVGELAARLAARAQWGAGVDADDASALLEAAAQGLNADDLVRDH